MKTKTTFTIIIAAVFIAAMIIYREKPLPELIAYFVGAAGTISAVWNWYRKNEIFEKYEELEDDNIRMRIEQNRLRRELYDLKSKKETK